MGRPKFYWRSKLIIVTAVFLLMSIPALSWASLISQENINQSLIYITTRQDSSGGIIEAENEEPSEMISAWCAMAYAAAGYSPASVKTGSSNLSLGDYITTAGSDYSLTTDVERYILAQAAANQTIAPHFTSQLIGATNSSGLIGPDINSTVFGILAYSAAGLPVPSQSVEYLLGNQQTDGSWNSGYSSETNITAQAVMALVASGLSANNPAIVSAQHYFETMQIPSGGIKYDASEWTTTSDAFSDAYVLQALNAIGSSASTPYWQAHKSELMNDLGSLRQSDGSYDFSSTYGAVNPVWTTSIAVIALAGQYLPVKTDNLTIYGATQTQTIVDTTSSAISTITGTATATDNSLHALVQYIYQPVASAAPLAVSIESNKSEYKFYHSPKPSSASWCS